MKTNLPLFMLLLTQLTGCMTTKTLETAEANGKILRYESRYFVALDKPENPNLVHIPVPDDHSFQLAMISHYDRSWSVETVIMTTGTAKFCGSSAMINHSGDVISFPASDV